MVHLTSVSKRISFQERIQNSLHVPLLGPDSPLTFPALDQEEDEIPVCFQEQYPLTTFELHLEFPQSCSQALRPAPIPARHPDSILELVTQSS